MVYSFELMQHPNIRYREAVSRLGHFELFCMLKALGVSCTITEESLGGACFLSFECRELSEPELSFIRRHSTIVFSSVRHQDGGLYPLSIPDPYVLPEDLPELLKYKGKTSVSFTSMMINVALSLTPFAFSDQTVTLLDPLCGKGTSLFCALRSGMNAIGMDVDQKSIHEASEYFSRYLKYHHCKHRKTSHSESSQSGAIPVVTFDFSPDRAQYAHGDTRRLSLAVGDASFSPCLARHRPVHLMVADLPYGIQHAPRSEGKTEPFQAMLARLLPVWHRLLVPDGALALSFNTLTLPTASVMDFLTDAGFRPVTDSPFTQLKHEVEQAVVRDVIFALKS